MIAKNKYAVVKGVLHLNHKSKCIRMQSFARAQGMIATIVTWTHEIKPAVKRGEDVSIKIEFQ